MTQILDLTIIPILMQTRQLTYHFIKNRQQLNDKDVYIRYYNS